MNPKTKNNIKFFLVVSTGIIIGMMIGYRVNSVIGMVGVQAGFLISYFLLNKYSSHNLHNENETKQPSTRGKRREVRKMRDLYSLRWGLVRWGEVRCGLVR